MVYLEQTFMRKLITTIGTIRVQPHPNRGNPEKILCKLTDVKAIKMVTNLVQVWSTRLTLN